MFVTPSSHSIFIFSFPTFSWRAINTRFLTISRDSGAHLLFENGRCLTISRELGAHLLGENGRFLTISRDLGAHLLFENGRFLPNRSAPPRCGAIWAVNAPHPGGRSVHHRDAAKFTTFDAFCAFFQDCFRTPGWKKSACFF